MRCDKGFTAFAMVMFSAPVPAYAQPLVGMAAAFQNTIVSTYEDGRIAKLWIDPDGSYRGEGRKGDASSGHWSVKGEKLCLKQAHPLPILFSYCVPIIEGGIGTEWKTKSVFGEPITVVLAQGR